MGAAPRKQGRSPGRDRPAATAAPLGRLMAWAAFWTFLADQATKWLVVHWLDLGSRREIDVWPPFVNFRMAWNEGVNFGLFAGLDMRWILVGLAVTVSAFVAVWVRRDGGGRLAHIAAGLLIGGAIGNVVDRVLYGAVADFLNVSCCGIANPYAFNVADVAVFVGAGGLVAFGGRGKGEGRGDSGGRRPVARPAARRKPVAQPAPGPSPE